MLEGSHRAGAVRPVSNPPADTCLYDLAALRHLRARQRCVKQWILWSDLSYSDHLRHNLHEEGLDVNDARRRPHALDEVRKCSRMIWIYRPKMLPVIQLLLSRQPRVIRVVAKRRFGAGISANFEPPKL